MKTLNLFLFLFFLLFTSNLNSLSEEKAEREILEIDSKVAWNVDGKFIMPECFEYEWLSSDNYQKFFELYIGEYENYYGSKEWYKFSKNIGKYLNKEVPLNHKIDTGWHNHKTISVTKNLRNCLSEEAVTKVIYRTLENGRYYTEKEIGYKILHNLNLSEGKELAPNINEQFHSIREIEITSWQGGTMGYEIHVLTYGVLKLNEEILLLPLNRIEDYIPKYEKYPRKES